MFVVLNVTSLIFLTVVEGVANNVLTQAWFQVVVYVFHALMNVLLVQFFQIIALLVTLPLLTSIFIKIDVSQHVRLCSMLILLQ